MSCGLPSSPKANSGLAKVGCLCINDRDEKQCFDGGGAQQLRVYANQRWAVINKEVGGYQATTTVQDPADICYATVVKDSPSVYSKGPKAPATCQQVIGFCIQGETTPCCSGEDGAGCSSCSNVKYCDNAAPATMKPTTTVYNGPTTAPPANNYNGYTYPATTAPYGNPAFGGYEAGAKYGRGLSQFPPGGSPAFDKQPLHSGGIPFTACSKVLGCFANQGCFADQDCVGVGITNKCEAVAGGFPGVCNYYPAIPRMYGMWGLMSVTILTWIVCCFFTWRRDRAAAAPRRGKEEAKQNAPSELKSSGDFYKDKSEAIFQHSSAIVDAHDRLERLQNATQIALSADIAEVVGLYRMLACATIGVTHQEGGVAKAEVKGTISPVDECMLRLEKMQSEIEYVLDGANPMEKRKANLPGLRTSLLKTIDRHPYVLDGKPMIDAVASGHYTLNSEHFRQFESRTLSLLPVFQSASSMIDINTYDPAPEGASWFPRMRRFKAFYFVFWAILIVTWIMMVSKTGLLGKDLKDSLEELNSTRPGGMGKLFFPMPVHYTLEIDPLQYPPSKVPGSAQTLFPSNLPNTSPTHPWILPFIYGFMHCGLLTLGFLPLPVSRGLWRDIVSFVPAIKKWMPIDEFEDVHRQLGYLFFAMVGAGAILWIVSMSIDCLNNFRDVCLTFDPIVNHFEDPVENVLTLRFVVWSTWFTVLPLMAFAFETPPFGLIKITPIRKYWYELLFFSHCIVAYVGLVLALLGRFFIFYPVLLSWGIYFLDKLREFVFHSYGVTLASRQSFNRSNSGYPTAVRLHFEKPAACKVTAGQWMYLMVPSIDQVWHPFSICSASGDDVLSFHIGIRCIDPAKEWTSSRGIGSRSWTLSPETWTYKLFKKLDVSHPYLKAYVRGPYGAAFTSCFNPLNAGVMVIGAGTGLTAAESVVREILQRKMLGTPVPSRLWFVWATRSVDDLFWCWQAMIELLLAAFDAQTLDAKAIVASGSTLDWLGVTIYVSRADKESMALLKSLYPKPTPPPVREPVATTSGRMRATTDAPSANGGRARAVTEAAPKDEHNQYQAIKHTEQKHDANIYQALGSVMAQYTKPPSKPANAGGDKNGIQYDNLQAYQPMKGLFQGDQAQPNTLDYNNDLNNTMKSEMSAAAAEEMAQARRAHVGHWMVNRIVEGSIDQDRTHIERHLRSMRRLLQNNSGPLSVCFCGPPGLAHTVEKATRRIATEGQPVDIEFSSDSQ